ncbi:hypothetical protein [Tautonia plasticadhaerens]|uniref:Uncharacterized protein n=1 Tax=Tautonia plasticadhaerens TaxID=2527974 RepID=A0A518HD20_9BACT|nr:hypothetical protein [Tautonia plasticadhaerens]QDV38751.1 hypothetical protein ElP_67080 [Tautonia plasticadhaerens]
MRARLVPLCLCWLLLGCGGGVPDAPDPAVAVDPDAPPPSPGGPPPGVGLRGSVGSLEGEQPGALLD